MGFRVLKVGGLLLLSSVSALAFGAPAPRLITGDYPHIYDVIKTNGNPGFVGVNISHSVVPTPTGAVGVIELGDVMRVIGHELHTVTVTALHMSNRCDEIICEVIGHQSYTLKKGGAAPGWEEGPGRLFLRLDDGKGTIKAAARARYSNYYRTAYIVRVMAKDGKVFKTILVDTA